MRLAGKYGAGVLSISVLQDAYSKTLKEFWSIAEDVASENNQQVSRDNWRLVMPVHLAETKKEAIEQSREGAAKYQRDYFENTMGFTAGRNKLGETVQGPREKIVEEMNDSGMWCIGTPDDLVEAILRLDEQSGGFGGFMIQATEFGNREQVLRSYELIARYVMPKFQGTTTSLKASQQWAADNRFTLMEARKKSIDKAANQYSKEKEEKGR
jgi:limonene 1,2-monooxygenase